MADEILDAKRMRQIIRLQKYAIRRGLPIMVFIDQHDMAEARDNMETGAIMNKMFDDGQSFFVPEQRHKI